MKPGRFKGEGLRDGIGVGIVRLHQMAVKFVTYTAGEQVVMSSENEAQRKSDLIDLVHHEHAHLRRLFDDLAESFASIADGEVGEESRREVVATAAEDLEVALDDMLHHFNQEEEIFFVELEKRFPELKPQIVGLVKGHEVMGQRTRWLQEQLSKPPKELTRNLEVILDVLRSMARLVEDHTEEETRLFDAALEAMPAEERQGLLERMRSI